MKAQSVRRVLGIVNVVLVVGLVGAGAWWFLEVRPASADAARTKPKWVDDTWKAYDAAARNVTPALIFPIDEKDLQVVTRPDLKERQVGVFVGPIPPEPRPATAAAPAPELPKGLEAIGRPNTVYWMPPGDARLITVVQWAFPSKKLASIRVGEFIRETPGEKGRFKLVAVERPDLAKPVYKLIYDVYESDETTVVLAKQESVFDLSPGDGGKPSPITVGPAGTPGGAPVAGAPGAGTTPATGPGAAPAPTGYVVAGGAPPPASAVRITPQKLGDNYLGIEFDDTAHDYFYRSNPDALLSEVKTDVATDEAGNPRGLRISSVPQGSVASQFDVKNGDILVSINGTPVHSRSDAINVIKGMSKDIASVKVVIDRNGRLITYDVDPRDPAARRAAGKVRFTPPPK